MFVKPLNLSQRPRRLRRTATLRQMIRETALTVDDLIYPMFVTEGEGQKVEIASMPGCYRYSLDLLLKEIAEVSSLGINAIALFPVIPEHQKDETGTESYNPEGLVQQTVKAIKQAVPNIIVITDVALDPFTTHGHDGLVDENGTILNDPTVEVLVKMALSQAAAQMGWIDEKQVILETLTGMKRAGADLILTYFAKEVALIKKYEV
jgi:porphobilinogen synthase